jgi:hypothetical protein
MHKHVAVPTFEETDGSEGDGQPVNAILVIGRKIVSLMHGYSK